MINNISFYFVFYIFCVIKTEINFRCYRDSFKGETVKLYFNHESDVHPPYIKMEIRSRIVNKDNTDNQRATYLYLSPSDEECSQSLKLSYGNRPDRSVEFEILMSNSNNDRHFAVFNLKFTNFPTFKNFTINDTEDFVTLQIDVVSDVQSVVISGRRRNFINSTHHMLLKRFGKNCLYFRKNKQSSIIKFRRDRSISKVRFISAVEFLAVPFIYDKDEDKAIHKEILTAWQVTCPRSVMRGSKLHLSIKEKFNLIIKIIDANVSLNDKAIYTLNGNQVYFDYDNLEFGLVNTELLNGRAVSDPATFRLFQKNNDRRICSFNDQTLQEYMELQNPGDPNPPYIWSFMGEFDEIGYVKREKEENIRYCDEKSYLIDQEITMSTKNLIQDENRF